MSLLKNETWDDYLNKEVYVTADYGSTGFLGILQRWDDDIVVVEEEETGKIHKLPHDIVYGTWILKDW